MSLKIVIDKAALSDAVRGSTMCKFLVKWGWGKRLERVRCVQDAVLGDLVFDQDGEWWSATVQISGQSIGFKIAGDSKPHEKRIARAHEIVKAFAEFDEMVATFISDEAAKHRLDGGEFGEMVASEIKKLRIEDICLLSAKNPDDGMIYFKGLDIPGSWRCDYVNGKAAFLGCDT